jgi:hypothetical protein
MESTVEISELWVDPAGLLDLGTYTLTVENKVTNAGTLRQRKVVNNSSIEFLHIQDAAANTKYRGVIVDSTPDGQNLGTTAVSVRELNSDEYCTAEGSFSSIYAARCYSITLEFEPTNDVTVRLWGLTDELNDISESDLAVYRHLGPGLGWEELGDRVTGNDGAYSYAQGTTSGFSAFLLGQTGNTPTAVQLQDFSANEGTRFFR